MITNVLQTIQQHFIDNWSASEVQFSSQEFAPTGDSWVILDILPTYTRNTGYSTNLTEIHTIYVTCFNTNQTTASMLADQIIPFLQNQDFNGIRTGSYQPRQQGPVVSTKSYFVKLSFQAELTCEGPPRYIWVPIMYDCSVMMDCAVQNDCKELVLI